MDGNQEIHTTDAGKAPENTLDHSEHERRIAPDKLQSKLPSEILHTLLAYNAIT